MTTLIHGKTEALKRWAAPRIPYIVRPEVFGLCSAVGIASGSDPDDRLYAVCIYHGFVPAHGVCQISIAAASPYWATRETVRELLALAFYDLDCWKVFGWAPHKADRTIRLIKAFGGTREGTLKDHFSKGCHAEVFRLLRPDFERRYGKKTLNRAIPQVMNETRVMV